MRMGRTAAARRRGGGSGWGSLRHRGGMYASAFAPAVAALAKIATGHAGLPGPSASAPAVAAFARIATGRAGLPGPSALPASAIPVLAGAGRPLPPGRPRGKRPT